MADAEFKVEGLDDLLKKLDRLPENLEKNVLRGAIRASATPIVKDAKARVPVLQTPDARRVAGALRRSIHARSVQMKNGRLTGGVTAGGSDKSAGKKDTYYARFVEFGTAKMQARPFLRPAIDHQTGAATEAFGTYIRDRLKEFIYL